MRINIRMAGLIAVAIMLAMVPAASATFFTWCGNVTYSTTGELVPDGWTIQMENLNQTYVTEPWDQSTELYMIFNARCDGIMESDNDWIYVNVTSPDGLWFGETTGCLADMEYWLFKHIQDITVYEQTLPTENFTISLPAGWNLISLPLTPTDNSVIEVLSGVSDVVYRYNATLKQFECPSTVDPGIGYFVHVTTPCTWEYEGTPVTSTSSGLKSGLNMIGVPNCTMSVSDAMGSADYRYVARWNAADQEFEVYNPSAPVAFHGFTMMAAGEGYFVSAKSDDGAFAISCPS